MGEAPSLPLITRWFTGHRLKQTYLSRRYSHHPSKVPTLLLKLGPRDAALLALPPLKRPGSPEEPPERGHPGP